MTNSRKDELAARIGRQRERYTVFLFAWASLGAVVAGSLAVGAAHRTSPFWLRDLIAWAVGAILAKAIVSFGFSRRLKLLLLGLTVAGLTGSLINHGSMGVHRWLDFGPLHINVATLLLPMLVVVLAADVLGAKFSAAVALGVAGMLWAQPDASQASAFVAAFVILYAGRSKSMSQRLILLAGLVCAALSWIRPNPLPPIPEVEGAVGVAWHVSPLIASVAIVCLVLTAAAPLLLADGSPNIRGAGIALSTYFAITAIAPMIGAYPVPLIGAGMSAITGFWIGFGCLIAFHRKSSSVRVPQSKNIPARDSITGDRRDFAII